MEKEKSPYRIKVGVILMHSMTERYGFASKTYHVADAMKYLKEGLPELLDSAMENYAHKYQKCKVKK